MDEREGKDRAGAEDKFWSNYSWLFGLEKLLWTADVTRETAGSVDGQRFAKSVQ